MVIRTKRACVFVHPCICLCVRACIRVFVDMCASACACTSTCVRAFAHMRGCMVHECVRACVCARACVLQFFFITHVFVCMHGCVGRCARGCVCDSLRARACVQLFVRPCMYIYAFCVVMTDGRAEVANVERVNGERQGRMERAKMRGRGACEHSQLFSNSIVM